MTASLRDFFIRHGLEKIYWVAYSGGMDSHVLLSLCASLRDELKLHINAIHVNHHISQQSDEWAEHCSRVCDQFGIILHQHDIRLDLAAGDSLEEVARERRYDLLSAHINNDDVLLTAHHQDDQAETMLIQLLRGAGPKGLSAMPDMKPFAKGFHARPLLCFPRAELLKYAIDKQLKWIEDESNQDTKLTRNFMRHSILPILSERWPGVISAIARSARHCADTQEVVDEYIHLLQQDVAGSKNNSLSVSKLQKLTANTQRLVIRAWIASNEFVMPNTKKLMTIIHDVLTARWDRMPSVEWDHVALRRHRDDLFLVELPEASLVAREYCWDMREPLELEGRGGKLIASYVQGAGMSPCISQVIVCFRDYANQQGFSARLKKLFQACDIPPWERASVPLLKVGNEMVGIVGYYLNGKYRANADERGIDIKMSR